MTRARGLLAVLLMVGFAACGGSRMSSDGGPAGAAGNAGGGRGGTTGGGGAAGAGGATGGTSGAAGGAAGSLAGIGVAGTSGAAGTGGGTFSQVWDFTADAEGWMEGFCDYPRTTTELRHRLRPDVRMGEPPSRAARGRRLAHERQQPQRRSVHVRHACHQRPSPERRLRDGCRAGDRHECLRRLRRDLAAPLEPASS